MSESCTPLCEDKQLTFKSEVADSIKLRQFTGDIKSLTRALLILLDNAVKFTESGSVTLNIHDEENDQYRFVISDTGIGISEEYKADIFNAFSQTDASISRKHHGLGFSLALCRELAATMGGNLDVKSELGKGSTFSFQIELKRSEVCVEQESNSIVLPSSAQPELMPNHRILVVEDDEMNQIIMESVLDNLGYEYVIAENGQIALNILEKDTAFDVVLMDCQMPEMDGFTATKRIRTSSTEIKDIPVLAVTVNLSSSDVDNCYQCGMNEVIEKPVSPELLNEKILAYVG